jgi:hypothetical protein
MVYERGSLDAELSAARGLRAKLTQPVPESEWKAVQSLDGVVYQHLEGLPRFERYSVGARLQEMYESPWRAVRYAVASAFADEPTNAWTASLLQKYADKLASELRNEVRAIGINHRAGYPARERNRAVLYDAIWLSEHSGAVSAFEVVRRIAKDKDLDPLVRREARAYIKKTKVVRQTRSENS